MLKARGKHKDGRPLVMLGLSDDNLAALRSREPILVDTAELGIENGLWICIFAGAADEAGLALLLANSGVRVPAELINHTPRPGEERRFTFDE